MSRFLGQPSYSPVRLGQAGVTCETTPEGGTRCSDGTYHPPGCPSTPGAEGTIQGAPPGGEFPVVPVAIAAGALAVGAAALALSGRHMGVTASLDNSYPAVAAELRAIAGKINGERAADAWNFSQMAEAKKKKYDLLFQQKAAEERLAKEERLWEQSHKNMEPLQAATAEVDRIGQEVTAEDARINEYRGYVEANASNIMIYRHNAEVAIAGVPQEFQAEARTIIDPCYKAPAGMRGAGGFLGQIGIQNRMPGGSIPGGYGVEYGTRRPKKLEEPASTQLRGFGRPAWKPYLGQIPMEAPVVMPASTRAPNQNIAVRSATEFGMGLGVGALIGLATNLMFPKTRVTEKAGWTTAAIGAGAGALGTVLALSFGEKPFFRYLTGVGGSFVGNGLSDVMLPEQRNAYMQFPAIAGHRRI